MAELKRVEVRPGVFFKLDENDRKPGRIAMFRAMGTRARGPVRRLVTPGDNERRAAEDAGVVNYGEHNVKSLNVLIKERGLEAPAKATKAQLVELLVQSDEDAGIEAADVTAGGPTTDAAADDPDAVVPA